MLNKLIEDFFRDLVHLTEAIDYVLAQSLYHQVGSQKAESYSYTCQLTTRLQHPKHRLVQGVYQWCSFSESNCQCHHKNY